jgi:hypothetical protein
MQGSKSIFTSLGIIGPVVTLLVMLIRQFFPNIVFSDEEVSRVVAGLIEVAGLLVGMYGRFTATKTLTVLPDKKDDAP